MLTKILEVLACSVLQAERVIRRESLRTRLSAILPVETLAQEK